MICRTEIRKLMEEIVRNGGFKLPIGFRFRPTDEELVVHYLKRKVYSFPLPAFLIPDHFNVFRSNPLDLPGDLKEKRYFFSKRKLGNEKKWNRVVSCCSAGAGYWKVVSGKEKQVVAHGTNQLLGMKKMLVFYHQDQDQDQDGHGHGQKTCWVMNEYRLLDSPSPISLSPQPQFNEDMQKKCMVEEKEDWVVCRIYEKKKKKKRKGKNRGVKIDEVYKRNKTTRNMDMIIRPPTIMDFKMEQDSSTTDLLGPPQPAASSSCSTSDHHQVSSSSNGSDDDDQEAISTTTTTTAASLCFPSYF